MSTKKNDISRREFILKAASAAVVAPLLISQAKNVSPAANKLRHVCIGVGGMGWHDLNKFKTHQEVDIVAICDVDEKNLKRAAEALPNAKTYADWRELFKNEANNFDSVNVSVPDHNHFAICFQAINMGKHVYCQKPMCHDVAEIRVLTEAAKKAGMEEMIIMGYDGELENDQELIDLLNAEDSNMREAAKPDFLDLDGDGDETESMKSAANEAVGQEEADTRWNDPIQMGMRDISKSATTSSIKAPSNFYREKLVSLKAQRKQIEFDMEQEAEPEGGPVADYYGDALQRVDGQIDMIMQKIRTNESMNEGFVSRLKKNLIGAELRK
jgi:hypothetical protein